MRTVAIVMALVVLLALLAGAGCMAVSHPVTYSRGTTLGRELMDLKEARDSGAIGEDEYNRLRRRLIESLGQPCGEGRSHKAVTASKGSP